MKNIILVVADSLRADITREIVAFPEDLPLVNLGHVLAGNSSTILSLPWMLTGLEVFSPVMSIPRDLFKLGYISLLVHSNPIVGRFSRPFHKVLDLAVRDPRQARLKKYNRLVRITKKLPWNLYAKIRARSFKNYLPYARIQEKLEAFKLMVPEGPYFAWIHLMDPHTPYYPRGTNLSLEDIISMNGAQISAVRGHYDPSPEEALAWKELYRLESAEMFWHLLAWLEGLDYDKTTVILTSDHGEEFGEHGHYGHKGDRAHPENLQVPFIVIGRDLPEIKISHHRELRALVRQLVRRVGP